MINTAIWALSCIKNSKKSTKDVHYKTAKIFRMEAVSNFLLFSQLFATIYYKIL